MDSWDSGKLWLKAKLFIDRANEHEQSSVDFAFWCALSLECLARSALTSVHPVLNADPREDSNLLYACGFAFSKPRSLPAHSVYIRLEKIVEPFQKHHRELCDFVSLQRNAHLHTADLPYENLGTGKWLPRYYDTLTILNEFIGKSLEDFIGPANSKAAIQLIKSLNAEIVSSVKSKINAHKKVFEAKPAEEKTKLLTAAKSVKFSLRRGENGCTCPSCGADAKLIGERLKEFPEKYDDGELYMEVEYMTSSFKCGVCSLSLTGVDEVSHAGLKTHFVETETTSLHDLYEPEHYPEYDNM